MKRNCNHESSTLVEQYNKFSVQICLECKEQIIVLEYETIEKPFTSLELRSEIDELLRWRKWHPNDEDLRELKEQAEGRNGDYKESLFANSVYIGALEARLRDFEYWRERK